MPKLQTPPNGLGGSEAESRENSACAGHHYRLHRRLVNNRTGQSCQKVQVGNDKKRVFESGDSVVAAH